LLVALLPVAVRADVTPVAVQGDRCELVVETARPGEPFYLVVGSLADASRRIRVSVRTDATKDPAHVPVAQAPSSGAWEKLVGEQAEKQERARLLRTPPAFAPAVAPAKTRSFHLLVKGPDLQNPLHYTAVIAELRAVGRHCQVYVDRDAAGQDGLAALLTDILRTFDEEVFPWASEQLGSAHDVDRDGRFTILLTPGLGKLQGGAVAVDGFVRGSDFTPEAVAPFGNRCDMMYLNSRLKPGPHLRTVLAHEYTHAVLYCEHTLETYLPVPTRQDEQSWLNEGLAHLVEEQLGYGWSNLDYRVSAYLSWPERYPLVVPDYFHTGLWRTPGTRGAAFLFLRSCRERHGLALLTRLARSNLAGVSNLEAATRERFAEAFRRWAVAQLLDGGSWARQAGLGRLCIGPRWHEVKPGRPLHDLPLAGTALLYLRLDAAGPARTRVVVEGEEGAALQVTLVRTDGGHPWLSLRCERGQAAGHVNLLVAAHGGDARLEAADWEPLVPTGPSERDPREAAAAWFAAAELIAGRPCASREVVLPDSAAATDLVFKVLARDAAGQVLSAWAVLPRGENGGAGSP
jgi:hypothetical protein